MASFSASYSSMPLLLMVGCLAMLSEMGLAQEQQQLAIEGTKQVDFKEVLECLGALPALGECGPDIFKILEGRQKAKYYSLSKNCCGAIFNAAAKCDLAKFRINPKVTKSILKACAGGAASPPITAVGYKSTVDKDLSWPNLF